MKIRATYDVEAPALTTLIKEAFKASTLPIGEICKLAGFSRAAFYQATGVKQNKGSTITLPMLQKLAEVLNYAPLTAYLNNLNPMRDGELLQIQSGKRSPNYKKSEKGASNKTTSPVQQEPVCSL